MTTNWQGIMQAVDITVWDGSKLVRQLERAYNLLHNEGEAFMLRAAFVGGRINSVIPDKYYLGLDNRNTVSESDTLTDLEREPTLNGYARQVIGSSNEFSVSRDSITGHFKAYSPIIGFHATGDGWGPVSNLFLSDSGSNAGTLISTAKLNTTISLSDGQSVTLRIVLMLRQCSN